SARTPKISVNLGWARGPALLEARCAGRRRAGRSAATRAGGSDGGAAGRVGTTGTPFTGHAAAAGREGSSFSLYSRAALDAAPGGGNGHSSSGPPIAVGSGPRYFGPDVLASPAVWACTWAGSLPMWVY